VTIAVNPGLQPSARMRARRAESRTATFGDHRGPGGRSGVARHHAPTRLLLGPPPDCSALTNAWWACRHNNRAYPPASSDSRTTKLRVPTSLQLRRQQLAAAGRGGHDSSSGEGPRLW
jgi:hypothetical protein